MSTPGVVCNLKEKCPSSERGMGVRIPPGNHECNIYGGDTYICIGGARGDIE